MANYYRSNLESGVEVTSIAVTTQPSSLSYMQGDTLDLSGIAITASANGMTSDVTQYCTFNPANGDVLVAAGTQTITVSYIGLTTTFTVSVASLLGIQITTPPTKTSYVEDEIIDLTGIEVTADYGAFTRDVTSECTFIPADGSYAQPSITAITATFEGESASTPISVIASSLDANSWSTIQSVASSGSGSQYWSVGDSKNVSLNGSVGNFLTLSNYQCKVYIIDFNYRGDNGIYFQGFKNSDGVNVAICDTKYNTRKNNEKYIDHYHWWSGTYATVYGGWAGTDGRYDILGSTNVAPSGYGSATASTRVGYDATSTCATNPKSGTLIAALPSDLRAVIAPWTVYSHNGRGGNTNNTEANVTASIDYLPYLAEYEIFGTRTYANQYEYKYQSQMQYYKNGNSKIKYNHSDTSTAVMYMTRSVRIGASTSWCAVSNSGSSLYNDSVSLGAAPAFRVA